MKSQFRKLLSDAADTFWLVPGLMVLAAVLAAVGLVQLDRSELIPKDLLDSSWLYNGGGTGARTLLGTIASSSIGVAGTVFSITIAALSLAAGQMGPRLLRNFTSDRGNQVTLGAFLATFSYALMVLRSVRTQNEGAFVPYLSLNVGILLAFACVGTLVYFVGHMASRINVDTVIELVSQEVRDAVARLTADSEEAVPPPAEFWNGSSVVADPRSGYLQHLDDDSLADWAAEHGTCIRLLIRPGKYLFPGTPVAVATRHIDGLEEAIRNATALGPRRVGAIDLEFAIRQLVEVAVRALSPGINDPHTALSVLDRLGAALCDLAPLHLASGVTLRDGKPALVVPAVDYDGLADAMFHMIRQNANGCTAVLVRLIEVLTAVASCERDPARAQSLQRHAGLVLADAERSITTPEDLDDVRQRHVAFTTMRQFGPAYAVGAGARGGMPTRSCNGPHKS